jgi:hypothetical protein
MPIGETQSRVLLLRGLYYSAPTGQNAIRKVTPDYQASSKYLPLLSGLFLEVENLP